jgi:hypothetical protein
MLQKGASRDSEDKSDDGGQSDVRILFLALMVLSLMLLQTSIGLTKLDSELACLCSLLEKKYSNDHNASYTYIDPVTLDTIPLTLFMMKEWARAMVVSPLQIPNH